MTRSVTLAGYVLLAAAVVVCQAFGLIVRRTATLGQAVAAVQRSRTGRVSSLVAWLWVGWHLFVRANWA